MIRTDVGQMLLSDLAQNLYLYDDAFVEYITYLQYWRKPEYAKYIK